MDGANRPDIMVNLNPEFMVEEKIDWVIEHRLDVAMQYRPYYAMFNYPDLVADHYPEAMANSRPGWTRKNRPYIMDEHRPDWATPEITIAEHDVIETLKRHPELEGVEPEPKPNEMKPEAQYLVSILQYNFPVGAVIKTQDVRMLYDNHPQIVLKTKSGKKAAYYRARNELMEREMIGVKESEYGYSPLALTLPKLYDVQL